VLALYWRQIRPFEGHDLRQSTGERARILRAASAFRDIGGPSLSLAMVTAPDAYQTAIDEIALCLAQRPLYRLQRLPGAETSERSSTTTRSCIPTSHGRRCVHTAMRSN
jgi:hypothetical protein